MGVFNSVYFKCPHCNEVQEDQFKPGGMQSWTFPDDAISGKMPLEYIRYFQDMKWECYSCGKEFTCKVDVEIKVSNPRIEK